MSTYIHGMTEDPIQGGAASSRTTVRRGAKRAVYDREEMLELLRDGVVAHVGVMTTSGPVVLPMAYGVDGEKMYLHGAQANALLGGSLDAEICATVTIVDGLVLAKTPFNHSMNYRSVVVRGQAREVLDEGEKLRALRLVTDHIAPTWDVTRRPSSSEIRATKVVCLPLGEMSGKVRLGGAVNDEEDQSAPYWSGQVPIVTRFGGAVSDPDAGDTVPPMVGELAGRDIHRRRHDLP